MPTRTSDWTVYYLDVADGRKGTMTVFDHPDFAKAAGEAHDSLNTGYEGAAADWFEIVAIVRDGVKLEEY